MVNTNAGKEWLGLMLFLTAHTLMNVSCKRSSAISRERVIFNNVGATRLAYVQYSVSNALWSPDRKRSSNSFSSVGGSGLIVGVIRHPKVGKPVGITKLFIL